MAEKSETVERVFSGVNDITSLAHYARCQAHEADLRSTHALLLADRAVEESRAVRGIADSLSKTARIVAKLALENMATIDAVSEITAPDNEVSDGYDTATVSLTDITANQEDGTDDVLVIEDVDGSKASEAKCADDGTCKPISKNTRKTKCQEGTESDDCCKDNNGVIGEDGGSQLKSGDIDEKSTLGNINALLVRAHELGIGRGLQVVPTEEASGGKQEGVDARSGDKGEELTKELPCPEIKAGKDNVNVDVKNAA